MVGESLQSEVDSARAAAGCREELCAERIVHERALAGRLRADNGDDDDLIFVCLTDHFLDELALEFKVLAIDELERLAFPHQLLDFPGQMSLIL